MNDNRFSAIFLLNATPAWLSLSRQQRNDFFEHTLQPIFHHFGTRIKIRLFDAEYYHGRVSDMMLVEAENHNEYRYFIELLRDTPVYTIHYFHIIDIIPFRENGFKEFENYSEKQEVAASC